MDGLPATAAETSLLHPSCAVLSIITSIIAAHHGAVTPAGHTAERSRVQAHPADAEFNSDFWRHTCTQQ